MQPDASTSENFTGRKRQRSTSGASESGGSSPKRAASEGPSLTSESGIRSSVSVEPQSFSHLSIIEDHDVDAYMAQDNTAFAPLRPRWRETSRAEKLEAFSHHSRQPLQAGHSWYMVATQWLKDWKMACRGQADKRGLRDEATLGPVDNSALVDEKGDLRPDLLDTTDYEVVPKIMWELFEEWYGQAEHILERKVTQRGDSKELFVECYVPRFKIYRLFPGAGSTITGSGEAPTLRISLRAPVRDFFSELSRLFNVAHTDARYWRATEAANETGLEYPVGRLLDSGAEPFDVPDTDLDKTLSDLLVCPTDEFIIEVKENGKWIIDLDRVRSQQPRQQEASLSSPSAHNGLRTLSGVSGSLNMDSGQPLFNSGGFFGEMSNRLGILSSENAFVGARNGSGAASSSDLKPPAKIIERSKVTPSSRTPGTLGLGNLGNTCFMNSALQCLAHNEELTDYFLTGLYREELNRDNPLGMGGAIAENFGSLLTRIWSPNLGPSSFPPREFKQQLQRFAPQFSGFQQHDSQELVAFLLDGLHEDLNRVLKKPYVENPDWEGGGDKGLVELARKSWEGYISRNDSAIVDLFQGQYKSTLVCPECQKVSITFDPFMYLTLPLPIKKKWRHDIFYIPWDTDKPHLQIPVEVDCDSSFKDLRRLLGRWTGTNPDHLMTLETFQCRFYRHLDDGVSVSDMSSTDHVLCFELPCNPHMNDKGNPRTQDDSLVLPVYTGGINPKSYSATELTGLPFLVVLSREQAGSVDSIYAAVVDRLKRWTANAKSLYTYVGVNHVTDEHVVSLANSTHTSTPITEIREDGEVIVTEAPPMEEADIADEKNLGIADDDAEMVEVNSEPVVIGPQVDLFQMDLHHFESAKVSLESGTYGARTISWDARGGRRPGGTLVGPGDVIVCKWDESLQTFFLSDEARWDKKHFETFIHPEYEAQRKLTEKKHNDLTVDDCLDEFTKEEKLGEDDPWYCPQCKKHQQATKNLQLWKVPDVLVVHLKRFSSNRSFRDKLDAFIDFPLHGLDLENRVGERRSAKTLAAAGYDVAQLGLGDVAEPLLYDLFAVDEHLGGLGGGHYRAYARNHVDGEWYYFDDSHVTRCNATDAVNRNAYLLFYRRRTTRPIGGKTHAKIQAARQSHVEKASALPTPPKELSPSPSTRAVAPTALDEDFPTASRRWTPSLPIESGSSSASSPPDLEDSDAPPGLEEEAFDPLSQSNLRYAMPTTLNGFHDRTGSPISTSSNEAADGGSEHGASPPWGKRGIADFVPSPPFAKAVLKPASFSPGHGDVGFAWGAGQEPPSPPSCSISEIGDSRVAEQWDSDDAQSRSQDLRMDNS